MYCVYEIEGSGGCTGLSEPSLLRICDQYYNLTNRLEYGLAIALSPPGTNLGTCGLYYNSINSMAPWSNQGLYCLPPQKI